MDETHEPTVAKRPGALEPMHRLSEVLFGLTMVLTVTGSFSVASATDLDVATVFLAALGCGIALGLIHGVMFPMGRLPERGADLHRVKALRAARTPETAHAVIRDPACTGCRIA